MTTASLVRGNALVIPLRDESVDLVVTSPPYFALRSYQDGGEHYGGQIGSEDTPAAFLAALWAVLDECWRVLKPSGSVFVNLGDKYVSDNRGSGGDAKRGESKHAPCGPAGYPTGGMRHKSLMLLPEQFRMGAIDPAFRQWKTGQGGPQWIARAVVIWDKPNGLPESVTDRVRRSHEDWVHLTKQPRYFAAVDEIREAYTPGTAERYELGYNPHRGVGVTANGVLRADNGGPSGCNPLGKLPGSVWEIPSEPLKVPDWLGVDHFAAYPQEWPRRLILGWSPEHGTILDPFGGTGTTAMVARALGRHGVSLDLSADYLRLARWRIFDSGHAAKTLRRTNAERQEVLL
jgi:site-specific DNA-methyltransferase (cytosine-N4-specific)